MTKKSLTDVIAENITLDKVNILEETQNEYRIDYKNETFKIIKDKETSFEISSQDYSQKLEMKLELRLSTGSDILQDESVPKEFKEATIFHELREIEYVEANLENPHERALNDEMLYIIKFFNEKTRREYLKFAKQYRKEKLKEEVLEKNKLNIVDIFNKWYENNSWTGGYISNFKVAEKDLKNKEVVPADIDLINFEINSKLDYFTLKSATASSTSVAFLIAAINKISRKYRKLEIKLPKYVTDSYKQKFIKDTKELLSENEIKELKEDFSEFLKRKDVRIEYEENKFLEF